MFSPVLRSLFILFLALGPAISAGAGWTFVNLKESDSQQYLMSATFQKEGQTLSIPVRAQKAGESLEASRIPIVFTFFVLQFPNETSLADRNEMGRLLSLHLEVSNAYVVTQEISAFELQGRLDAKLKKEYIRDIRFFDGFKVSGAENVSVLISYFQRAKTYSGYERTKIALYLKSLKSTGFEALRDREHQIEDLFLFLHNTPKIERPAIIPLPVTRPEPLPLPPVQPSAEGPRGYTKNTQDGKITYFFGASANDSSQSIIIRTFRASFFYSMERPHALGVADLYSHDFAKQSVSEARNKIIQNDLLESGYSVMHYPLKSQLHYPDVNAIAFYEPDDSNGRDFEALLQKFYNTGELPTHVKSAEKIRGIFAKTQFISFFLPFKSNDPARYLNVAYVDGIPSLTISETEALKSFLSKKALGLLTPYQRNLDHLEEIRPVHIRQKIPVKIQVQYDQKIENFLTQQDRLPRVRINNGPLDLLELRSMVLEGLDESAEIISVGTLYTNGMASSKKMRSELLPKLHYSYDLVLDQEIPFQSKIERLTDITDSLSIEELLLESFYMGTRLPNLDNALESEIYNLVPQIHFFTATRKDEGTGDLREIKVGIVEHPLTLKGKLLIAVKNFLRSRGYSYLNLPHVGDIERFNIQDKIRNFFIRKWTTSSTQKSYYSVQNTDCKLLFTDKKAK